MSPSSILTRLGGSLLPALALGLSATSAALVLISGYQLLRADTSPSALPHFMRQLKLPATTAEPPAFRPVMQRRGNCPCTPAAARDLMVNKPQPEHHA
ncbi:MAG: hypothetical protein C0423_14670 [Methylibium sp.]|nr:hypothetical protein [Methylibium sp.]